MTLDVNLKLARVLGIDARNCTGFDLRVRVDEFPTVVVHRRFVDNGSLSSKSALFELSQVEERFDLVRACDLAMHRVRIQIEASASRALAALKWRRE